MKHGFAMRILEQVDCSLRQVKRSRQLLDVVAWTQIDPQQLRTAKAPGTLGNAAQVVHLIAVIENSSGHCSGFPLLPATKPSLAILRLAPRQDTGCSAAVAMRRNRSVRKVRKIAEKPRTTLTQVSVSLIPTLNASSAERAAWSRSV